MDLLLDKMEFIPDWIGILSENLRATSRLPCMTAIGLLIS